MIQEYLSRLPDELGELKLPAATGRALWDGLPDGVRWAFLETPEGLLFDRESYAGAAGARSLDEIESYIQRMLAELGT